MRRFGAVLVLTVAVAMLPGCKKSEEPKAPPVAAATPAPAAQPVAVVALRLGSAVGADKKVTGASNMFSPRDTIYASVDTQGAATGTAIIARWTYQDGQTVYEETQALTLTGPATTEFHIARPDGWPKGSYKVEILAPGFLEEIRRVEPVKYRAAMKKDKKKQKEEEEEKKPS